VRDEYRRLFATCEVAPRHAVEIDSVVKRIVAHKDRYTAAGHPLGVPWWFVGITHMLEGSGNFKTHLHNGDPLTARTKQVPAGRPLPPAKPPFTWVQSARDALELEGFGGAADWSISHALHRFEKFNGFGYRSRHINSPYLWSMSQHYTRGKFVGDGVFDPNAVSLQCGAGVLLRVLVDSGQVKPLSAVAGAA
jgi:lysozyme family protein